MENNGRRCLAEKLDRDLGRDFIHRLLNFVGGLGQPIGVDVDSDATTLTGHVLVRLDPPDGLMEILPATGALKSDLMLFNVRHGGRASFAAYGSNQSSLFTMLQLVSSNQFDGISPGTK
jgi:hypothetical protein